jgi:hypothetical protein
MVAGIYHGSRTPGHFYIWTPGHLDTFTSYLLPLTAIFHGSRTLEEHWGALEEQWKQISTRSTGRALEEHWESTGRALEEHWESTGDTWGTPGGHLGDTWGTPGEHLGDTWGTPGEHLGNTWGTPGGHLGDTWGTPGGHLGDTWGASQEELRKALVAHVKTSVELAFPPELIELMHAVH